MTTPEQVRRLAEAVAEATDSSTVQVLQEFDALVAERREAVAADGRRRTTDVERNGAPRE